MPNHEIGYCEFPTFVGEILLQSRRCLADPAKRSDAMTDGPIADELDALRAIVQGTASSTGDEFFRSLVQHLARTIGARYAFVAKLATLNTRVRTLAYCFRDSIIPNVEFDLAGTPCEEVVQGSLCHHPAGVKDLFPRDRPLVEMNIESYLGVP